MKSFNVFALLQSDAKIDTVEISNHLGQNVLQTSTSTAIDISALADGIYLIKVTAEKASAVQKFIKI